MYFLQVYLDEFAQIVLSSATQCKCQKLQFRCFSDWFFCETIDKSAGILFHYFKGEEILNFLRFFGEEQKSQKAQKLNIFPIRNFHFHEIIGRVANTFCSLYFTAEYGYAEFFKFFPAVEHSILFLPR